VLDSFELNKILGAVLGTCLGIVALNIVAGAIFAPRKLEKPGFEIEVPATPAPGPPGQSAQPEVPLEQLLAKADVSRGAESAKKCAACHTFEKGGRTLVGPPLWGIVGRPKASVPGFNYSPGMKQLSGNWTAEDLFNFIANPRGMVANTSMTFARIPRATERADLIAYLNSLSDNPQPLTKGAQATRATRAAQAPDSVTPR
jgi:cytochrome c